MGSVWFDGLKEAKVAISLSLGTKLLFPGLELPDNYQHQVDEKDYIKPEDYDTIINMGWHKFMLEDYIFRLVDITKKELNKILGAAMPALIKAKKEWGDRGMESMYPPHSFILHPFFRLSTGRSMIKFMEDLYFRPEKAAEAMQVMTEEFIRNTINGCAAFNTKIAFIAEERASTTFFSPKIFEKYWWPYTEQIVNAFWDKGIVTWFHLDTNWDGNFKYFKKLPRGSAVLALDGTSNIFHAKKILNDHLCLAGDVQAALLSVGTPAEVEAYCKKLINEIGGNGGYILSSGCEIPEAVKMENLKAMIQTGKTYKL
ncbi:MAG: uroporphyrinogen decarboxylase family protein [Candidatus Hodarchaeota archaeon]